MSRHLADKPRIDRGTRLREFLRIARQGGDPLWQKLATRPVPRPQGNRRMAEFLRIARGRTV